MNLANLAPASRLDRVLAYLTDAVVVAAVLGALWWFFSSPVLVGITLVELVVVMALLRARTGRTPGGWATGTVAIAYGSNHAPGLKRQFIRTFLMALLHLTVVGPVLSGALSRDGRDWVDQMAGTAMVSLRREPAQAPSYNLPLPTPPQSYPMQAPPPAPPFPQPVSPPPTAPVAQAPAVPASVPPAQPPFQVPAAQPTFQAPAAQPSFQAPAAQPTFQAPAQPSSQPPQALPAQQAPLQPPPAPAPPPAPPAPPQAPAQPSWPVQAPPAAPSQPQPPAPQPPPVPQVPAQPVASSAPAQGIWDEAPDAFDPPTTRRNSIGWTQPQPLPSPQPSPIDSQASPPTSTVPRRAASASQSPAPSSLETQSLSQAVAEEAQTTAACLVLDSGQREPVDSTLVIGRSPTAGSSSERAVVVADSTQSLSRVHVRISPAPGGVLVEDARSTNGTAIQSAHGASTPLVPDKRIWVPLGTTLVMGRRSMHVMAAD